MNQMMIQASSRKKLAHFSDLTESEHYSDSKIMKGDNGDE